MKGFTLVELLVVVAGVLVGAGVMLALMQGASVEYNAETLEVTPQ